jgi:hypothetical protein
MTRETGLSPRRAPKRSRLPLSPRRTQVRLRPLLSLRPHPPKGGTPRERDASLPLPSEHPVLTLAYAQPACSRDSSRSHGAVRSARVPSCGLKRLRPGFAGPPDLNPRTRLRSRSQLLPFGLYAPCQPANCRFRFAKKNCNANQFFSPHRNRSIPGEKKRARPSRSGDGRLETNNN